MVKNIKIISKYPPVVEVQFDPFLTDKEINDVFSQTDHFNEHPYNKEQSQKPNRFEHKKYDNIVSQIVTPFFDDITKYIIQLDPLNYPIYYGDNENKEEVLTQWYDEQKLWKKRYALPILDKPGFGQGPHIDNRFVLWAGVINLQNNSTTTKFYYKIDEHNYTPWYSSSGKKWTGTFWLNTENTWHGLPDVTDDRKIILCNQWLCNTGLDPK